MKKKKSNKNKYIIIGSVLLLALLLIGKKAGWFGGSDTIAVAIEEAQKRDITEYISASGKIQPKTEVKISPDVSGEVVELYVNEGDNVRKGDKLARIKPDTYQANYEQIKASYNAQKANLANAKARLAQANAQFINAEAIYKRNVILFEQKVISKADFDNVKASFDVGKAEVEAAEQSVKAAEYSLISTEASLTEAQNNLNRTTLFAPMDGTVYQLTVEVGERVAGASQFSSGTEIMRIADLNEMEIKVSINENDIVRVNNGDTAVIKVDAYLNKQFSGVVTQVSNAVQTLTSSAEQVTNYDVRIRIIQESYKELIDETRAYPFPFRPGMSASVDVITNKVSDVISIPIQAVTLKPDTATTQNEIQQSSVQKNNKEAVFVVQQDKVSVRFVETGTQDSFHIQIISGLNEGENVVVSPYSAITRILKNNDKVKIVEQSKVFEK